MKSLAIALLLGAVSSKSLNAEPSIWDESTEAAGNPCTDSWARWAHASNSWNTYKQAYLGGQVYEENDFGANMGSIYSTSAPPQGGRAGQYDSAVKGWRRPQDIYPGEEVHLKGTLGEFAPAGIKQGGLSDCWFLAGATALAEDPVRLHQNVHKNSRGDYNPTGVFRYFFWVENQWVAINIDDRLPVAYKYYNSADYFKPFGADRSNFGAWWMPLFEKAYAKLNGNYDRIEWGSGYESLRQLSARPVFFYQHEKVKANEGDEFRLFHKFAQENYPMVISCCDVPRGSQAPDGLQNAHAYTLLDVIQLDGTKLAKIRNPWSIENYNGAWSDDDPKWTPALLKKAGHTKANDGVFFMPFHQFLNKPYFRSTTVNIYKDFASSKIYDITQRVQQMAITIKIPSRQVVYFSLETANPRFKKNCRGAEAQVFVNTYFYPGRQFPGESGMIFPLGYMGSSMYHVTVGKPDYVLDRGTYTLMVANWAQQGNNSPLNYKLIVYQEGSGTVKVTY